MKATIWFKGKVDAAGNTLDECEANAATDLDWMGVFDVEITQTEVSEYDEDN